MIAVDHFAGTGWGVACHWLGIEEKGVELMPEAIATRDAVGFETIYHDVWDGLLGKQHAPAHDLFISSPPCQTFSVAGRGTGRQALDQVLTLVRDAAWMHPLALHRAGELLGDDRTALVLTPLAHVYQHRPELVILEQVPTVLPVWEATAVELRTLGYSVWVGLLQAEMYGVPQTRKRAILVARRDGAVAKLPTPTHSLYYSRDPQRLDEGVLPWVSMAEALGWGSEDLVGFPRRSDGLAEVVIGGTAYRARDLRSASHPAQTVTEKARSWSRFASAPRAWGFTDRPAVTVGNAVGRGLIGGSGAKAAVVRAIEAGTFIPSQGDGSNYAEATRITVEEAGVLQSYPRGFPFQGTKTKQFLQVGNAVPPLLAEAIIRGVLEA